MQPIRITAHLLNGFTSSDPWSPSIDGILGYWMMYEAKGDDFALSASNTAAMRPVEGLPLQRIEHGGLWWYACSSPIYSIASSARRYMHRRFDDAHERQLDLQGKSGKVLVAAGPYKNARIPFLLRITRQVEWHVIGDLGEIKRLLSRCPHIGGRYGSGFGRVSGWSFSDGDSEKAMHHRPLPVAYAEAHDIIGDEMYWGIRPPARLRENSALCIMPEAST